MNPCQLAPYLCDVAGDVATGAAESVLGVIADQMLGGVRWAMLALVSWLLVPSIDLERTGAVGALRQWLLPIVALVLVCGLTWQGLLMAMSRRGQPLVQAVRGLWTTAVWGAAAVVGTTAALRAGDAYSCWVLVQGLRAGGEAGAAGDGPAGCAVGTVAQEAFRSAATRKLELLLLPTTLSPGVAIILAVLILLVLIVQVVLMLFRNGSLIILVGLSQVAAAGSVTRTTSAWVRRVFAWMLALVCYKPVAASVYAVTFLLIGSNEGDPWALFMGLGMLALSLVAMPALMRFFNWGVGAVGGDGAGAHMIAGTSNTAMAANMLPSGDSGSATGQAAFLASSLPSPPGPPAGSATGAGTAGGTAASGTAAAAGAGAGTAAGAGA
ncbi:MAG TPA: hypothetical protein VF163_21315, partial [Micromonosporaceae bacterium]